jgi:hypothetical protein
MDTIVTKFILLSMMQQPLAFVLSMMQQPLAFDRWRGLPQSRILRGNSKKFYWGLLQILGGNRFFLLGPLLSECIELLKTFIEWY